MISPNTSWLSRLLAACLAQMKQRPSSSRRRRSQRGVATAAEVCVLEPRRLLSGLTAGLNVNISQLAGNQDESAIVVNPTNPPTRLR